MQRGLVTISIVGLVFLAAVAGQLAPLGRAQPVSAQWGVPEVSPSPPGERESQRSRESFRQSVSPQLVEKTASIIVDVLAAMHQRRAAAKYARDWSDLTTPLVHVTKTGEIQVYVILSEFRPEFVGQLEALGLRVELTSGPIIQGWVPADAIESLAALDFVRQIRPPGYALHNQSGAVDTAGNSVLRANDARAAFGVSGAGVPIGVISDGADHRANSIASGDLPPQGTILRAGVGDEGTAMMEIIHDLAPGSPLLFFGVRAVPPLTGLQIVAGMNALATAGARVIVDDVVVPDQPKFEDGPIAQTARNFATGGRLYVTSANNFALQHYRAQYNFVDFPFSFGGRSYARVHNYASLGTDTANRFAVPLGCSVRVFLQWNSRVGAASDDFDLFLVRASDGVILNWSLNPQSGTQDPYESLFWANPALIPQTVFVGVAEFGLTSPPGAQMLDYFVIPSCPSSTTPLLQYNVPDASVWGQAAVSEVLSVAAANANTPGVIEAYSAHGPGAVSFPVPENRVVPNITGVDCVETEVGNLGFFGDGPFCGTSAAAPHVAAIAALLMERAPGLSSAQYKAILTGTAVDLGTPGFDFTSGFGRVDALAALQAATAQQRLVNISTRALVETGDDVMIGGFVISGSTPKRVLVRAIGPSLANFGVPGVLANPSLLIFSGPTAIAQNDEWQVSLTLCQATGHVCGGPADIAATGLAPTNPLESAILITLAPGAYTAIVSGVSGSTGVGLVEVYEVDGGPSVASRLINISTRGVVDIGDNVMIGGFVIGGSIPKKVLVRAIGPSLGNFGVAGALDLHSADRELVFREFSG